LFQKNLDEIGKAGGYLKWKSCKLVQRLTAPLKSTYDDILRSGGSKNNGNTSKKMVMKLRTDEVYARKTHKTLTTFLS
jgi:hypothetical protein